MTTLNSILVDNLQAVIAENGVFDADIDALRAIGASGVKLTSVQCLMFVLDTIAELEEYMSIMTALYDMVDVVDPLLRDLMTQLHAKRVANARQTKVDLKKSKFKADSKVYAASCATAQAQHDHDSAEQAVALVRIQTLEGEHSLTGALAAQLAHE